MNTLAPAAIPPRFDSVQCLSSAGLHRFAWTEWGARDNPRVAVCAHGLTRSGRDFDVLARALAPDFRVVCPDIAGRGRSGWLANAKDYSIPQYVSDCITLIARLGARQVDWVGTSMGGLIGMALAALPATARSRAATIESDIESGAENIKSANIESEADNIESGAANIESENIESGAANTMFANPIRRLVLNDIGPVLEAEAVGRIAGYVGQAYRFSSFEQGVRHLKIVHLPFGPHSEEEWRALGRSVLVPDGSGWTLHYDPRIGEAFRAQPVAAEPRSPVQQGPVQQSPEQESPWTSYDRISCPTLAIRGAESDLISAATHREMAARGPRAELATLPGIGHAPTLMHADQVELVRRFLLADRPGQARTAARGAWASPR